ncbi:MAG: phenylalanine--tRNA ligase subunit beta [Blastocatellia bacterium]|nr:phenylalanine--tRNA ligase subunit beta [Blastocatellia bacterium]
MKISYNWLRQYVETSLSPRELAEKLTCVGLAVDSVDPQGDDFVLDFDLTSNRPDALSHVGIAREAAAICGTTVKLPAIAFAEVTAPTAEAARVTIEAPDLCPRYTARVIRGIKVGPSPDWLVKRLEAVGQRSISNVVDVTNFVLLELGHPLHAFDYDKVTDHHIIVRTAREAEPLTTLDGNDRTLNPSMLVIADAKEAVAMGGIMGGGDSEISDTTVNVLLESAYFEPNQVRRTARALELHTEASHRFERGADCEMVVTALNRCAQLIQEVAGGEILAGVIDVYPQPQARSPIMLRHERIAALTGVEVEPERVVSILTSLGFTLETVAQGEAWRAVAPSYRRDVNIEEDLIEEVVRLVGYDAIPTTLPGWGGAGSYLPGESERRRIRQTLTGQGFSEAISFSWMNEAKLSLVSSQEGLLVLNPLDKHEGRMRTTLLPGLLNAVAHNFNYGTANLRLFEVGKIFLGTTKGFEEREQIALAITGSPTVDDWSTSARMESFYTLKGVLERMLEALQIDTAAFVVPEGDLPGLFFTGQTAQVLLEGAPVGWVGRVSLKAAELYRFKQPVFVAELNLPALLERPQTFKPYRPLPKFPTVERDISAFFDTDIAFATIRTEVFNLGLPALKAVNLREVFTGKQIPAGKHSLMLNLVYRLEDRTLTDEEVSQQHGQVTSLLQSRFGAEIR